METRSNHILVGAVVLALLAAVVGFISWIGGRGKLPTNDYDIFFQQSVEGLSTGSGVTFAGVPSGTIKEIELWKDNPEFVRVRVAVNKTVPILVGTTAAIQGSFTGPSSIILQGAVKGAPEITAPGPGGVPTIPTKKIGIGALLNNAPQLLDRLSTLTERLNEVVSDKNQASLTRILSNVDQLTGNLRGTGPQLNATFGEARTTLVEARTAIRQTGQAADNIARLAGSAGALVNDQGRPMIEDLRKTVARASKSLDNLDVAVNEIKPGLRAINEKTIPEVSQLIRDMRAMSDALASVAAKIDQQGIGTIIGGPKLPDYVPPKGSQ